MQGEGIYSGDEACGWCLQGRDCLTLWLRYTSECTDLTTIRTIRRVDPKTRKVVSRHSGDTRRSRRAVVLPIPPTASQRYGSHYSQGSWSREAPGHYREDETSENAPHTIP
jgi:hypothetical protein